MVSIEEKLSKDNSDRSFIQLKMKKKKKVQVLLECTSGGVDYFDVRCPGVGNGQGGLACCGSWGCKESNTTEQLN